MSARKISTRSIDKAQYQNYWKKAVELREASRHCMVSRKWNAAAFNAIHASISANDALLVFFHGLRSRGPKHDDAVKLLSLYIKHEKTSSNAAHLKKLLTLKNVVEYESRLFTQGEAQKITRHAERFMEWVESLLP